MEKISSRIASFVKIDSEDEVSSSSLILDDGSPSSTEDLIFWTSSFIEDDPKEMNRFSYVNVADIWIIPLFK